MPFRAIALTCGLVLLLGCLGVLAVRVVMLERRELELVTEYQPLSALRERPEATRVSARLAKVDLERGESTLLEVCALGGFDEARDALKFVFWIPTTQTLALNVPLDAAHLRVVKRSRDRACLTLGGGRVDRSGGYALDAVWGSTAPSVAVSKIPMRARILARTPLSAREGLFVVGAALGAMITVLSLFVARAKHQAQPHLSRGARHAVSLAIAGTLLAATLTALVLRIPIAGSIGGFTRGLCIASIEIALAFVAARFLYGTSQAGLSLHAPHEHPSLWLFAAVGCAALLNPMARWAISAIPASGEAPIEAFISWPSGALTFAALGMCVPLSEEVFFRGFVFGALRSRGPVLAFVGTVVLFAAAHAQQAWGNWGALLSVTVTGLVLTTLRAVTGSTLVPAVAHLLYNLSLWKDSFSG